MLKEEEWIIFYLILDLTIDTTNFTMQSYLFSISIMKFDLKIRDQVKASSIDVDRRSV
ncbi:MAG: hypothetical protein M3R08_01625 [Bacteroidota bacterium]|nr:hypothetical protein [Bacteroidota bacterium]